MNKEQQLFKDNIKSNNKNFKKIYRTHTHYLEMM